MSDSENAAKHKTSIGIFKEIDKVGRIVIPKEFRERFGLENHVEMIITTDGLLIRNPKYMLVEK